MFATFLCLFFLSIQCYRFHAIFALIETYLKKKDNIRPFFWNNLLMAGYPTVTLKQMLGLVAAAAMFACFQKHSSAALSLRFTRPDLVTLFMRRPSIA